MKANVEKLVKKLKKEKPLIFLVIFLLAVGLAWIIPSAIYIQFEDKEKPLDSNFNITLKEESLRSVARLKLTNKPRRTDGRTEKDLDSNFKITLKEEG